MSHTTSVTSREEVPTSLRSLPEGLNPLSVSSLTSVPTSKTRGGDGSERSLRPFSDTNLDSLGRHSDLVNDVPPRPRGVPTSGRRDTSLSEFRSTTPT